MSDGITVTAAQLKLWGSDKVRLENEIAQKQQELAAIQRRLEAASVLAEPMTHSVNSELFQLSVGDEGGRLSMTLTIEKIANESPAPITKKDLKKMLLSRGFRPDQLQAYMYTPIMRLKNSKRISVLSDGRIWKAPG